VRPTRSLFTNVPDIVSCIDVIESKSMASMLSLNRGVLLGAYSTIIHRQSMEVGFDLTPIRHIILPFVRFVFFVVEIS
jgi:hypothetical protein